MTEKHSPTPWFIEEWATGKRAFVLDAKLCSVAGEDGLFIRETAERIVEAVNAHERLVDALKSAKRNFDEIGMAALSGDVPADALCAVCAKMSGKIEAVIGEEAAQ